MILLSFKTHHVLPVLLIAVFAGFSCCKRAPPPKSLPNIIIFYVDDLGYGDVGCYGAQGVATPNIDQLAKQGLRFTDAHCSAATCTPSRYSLLTGEYAFRNNAQILPGNAPLIIDTNQITIGKMLQEAGYATGVVGKWHLGLGKGNLDWNQPIKPGPLEVGFDYCFLIPATGDRVPTVYVENHLVVDQNPNDPIYVDYKKPIGARPSGLANPELLRVAADPQHSNTIVNGVSRIGYMQGGEKALWVDEDFPDLLNAKAKSFVRDHQEQPFFLFYSYHDIHVPRLPHPRFQGKSQMGARGDVIAQMDWMTGEIIKELELLGIQENTLVIFTSDNGPVLTDGYADGALEKLGTHLPAGPLRGGKYSAYEAGTRVPTIAYWPGTIAPGNSPALLNQIDLLASLASLVGQPLSEKTAIDSKNLLPTLLGETKDGRTEMIEESYTLSLRTKQWKYIRPLMKNQPLWIANDKNIEGGFEPFPQLYDLENDLSEEKNLAEKFPKRVLEMENRLIKLENKTQR